VLRVTAPNDSPVSNAEKEIALHKIPFFGDHRSEAKARRKKWADFVKLKRAKLTAKREKTLPDGIVLAASNSSEHSSKMRLVSFRYRDFNEIRSKKKS